MDEIIFAVRGATTLDSNSTDEIILRSNELFDRILLTNGLTANALISVVISTTSDITEFYPAAALRQNGLTSVPLFSALEPPIKNSLPLCIRMLITARGKGKARHVYMRGAQVLRPDLD